ncbi:WD40 repeat-like protein [Rhizopogon vinicolor AM-OR11-026]|uniref:WD40 repeat-like protein n=1 Tax=Rhizopogon vinicolor AM-OR11-026 TaxID=1314800 RepID=A0A1B7MP24_9AGAM|nr:WD40 repeat-like protein [Rhizopogon vinicolor AM-OR11-026]
MRPWSSPVFGVSYLMADLQAGKEIGKARKVREYGVRAVAVSGGSRWVVTADRDLNHGELKAREVETGIVKTFHGHSGEVSCIDISADGMLLASGSEDYTVQIWRQTDAWSIQDCYVVGWAQFGSRLTQRSSRSKIEREVRVDVPVFWTNKGTRILAVFNFLDSFAKTIYEFDALRVETVGAPFKGHTHKITGLALSSDGALIASTSFDGTIKLWALDFRQLLASFHAYEAFANVYICNIPPNIPATIGLATKDTPKDSQQHVFLLRLRKLFRSSSPAEAVPPILNEQLRDALEIPSTSRLHTIRSPSEATTQVRVGPRENWPVHDGHAASPIVDVPPAQGKKRNAAAGAPKQQDEDLILDEYCDDDHRTPIHNSQPVQCRPTVVNMGAQDEFTNPSLSDGQVKNIALMSKGFARDMRKPAYHLPKRKGLKVAALHWEA